MEFNQNFESDNLDYIDVASGVFGGMMFGSVAGFLVSNLLYSNRINNAALRNEAKKDYNKLTLAFTIFGAIIGAAIGT